MPVLFNYDTVDAVPMGDDVTRRPLTTPGRVNNVYPPLDRSSLNTRANTASFAPSLAASPPHESSEV